ncbi:thiamine-phosphate pyrophosphorylase [Methanocella paludicola SANAE]|uniref:Thiamine-phosphate synthase n=1 Tax=Methanocella paludicola (strain DSM 17711 / JCM 13418 / NBRC 101707 / SANAE) TaxID=304371 RepID=D1YXN6_METPS|nr:thiamine phosphate synthase [Methanocella paludicola]BAI61208.1 thiamine-phosphate pyrophosphorylase [Methanocella paludicola SANAE]
MTAYDLYVITDEGLSKGLTHVEIARRAIAGGADVIQLRDKSMSGEELMECAVQIRTLTKEAGVLFIVNDRLDIAIASKADGVHLGQEDIPVKLARPLAPPGFIIGVSAGTLEEALQAERDGADYIGLGPICHTGSKKDAGPVCGFGLITGVKKHVSIPVIVIGGIGPDNAKESISAGADGLAVISAVVSQDDVTGAAKHLKALIKEAKRQKVYEG